MWWGRSHDLHSAFAKWIDDPIPPQMSFGLGRYLLEAGTSDDEDLIDQVIVLDVPELDEDSPLVIG